jgi:hypothetical protein
MDHGKPAGACRPCTLLRLKVVSARANHPGRSIIQENGAGGITVDRLPAIPSPPGPPPTLTTVLFASHPTRQAMKGQKVETKLIQGAPRPTQRAEAGRMEDFR